MDNAALMDQIDAAGLPDEARAVAIEVARVLEQPDAAAAESFQAREYLEYLLALPWSEPGPPPSADPEEVASEVDIGQYSPPFNRRLLVDWMLSAHRTQTVGTALLCGPPGSGRRSLVRRVSAALELPAATIDLVGTAGESDVLGTGSSQTRGAIGSLARALAEIGTRRGVIVLANVQWAVVNWPDRGAGLLSLLGDTEARRNWRDQYLDVGFDLSSTLFVLTADGSGALPPEIVDHMLLVDCPGYTRSERSRIVRTHLWDEIKARYAITAPVALGEDAAEALVSEYTPEAGLAATGIVLSEIARRVAAAPEGSAPPLIDAAGLSQMLGKPRRYYRDEAGYARPGACRTLLLGPHGSNVQLVEAVPIPGGRFYLTPEGTSPLVNKACDTAYYYVRSRMTELDISARQLFEYGYKVNHNLGASDVDAETLSLAVLVALISALRDRPVDPETAVVGEMNQNGVLMGGPGLAHRLLAAQRAGIRRVLLPRANAPDIEELPPGLESDLTLVMVSDADQAIRVALS
jgi:ATP-dependent Lon protease